MIPPLHEVPLEDCCGGRLKQAPFGRVKDALSGGASSMIIRPTGKEFYSRYIQWSIIGGVRYLDSTAFPKSFELMGLW